MGFVYAVDITYWGENKTEIGDDYKFHNTIIHGDSIEEIHERVSRYGEEVYLGEIRLSNI